MFSKTCFLIFLLIIACSISSTAEVPEETLEDVIIEHIIYKDLTDTQTKEEWNHKAASLEGPSDWTGWQYNNQHTGYNDKDSITMPLELRWYGKYDIGWWCPFDPVSVVGNRVLLSNGDTHAYSNPGYQLRCMDADDGTILWFHEFDVSHKLSQASYANGFFLQPVNVVLPCFPSQVTHYYRT